MSGFIFEGPDGAGKSFTALEVSRAVGLPIHHSGGPPKSRQEMFNRVERLLTKDNIIFDRFPLISDHVYGPIIRNESLFSLHMLQRIKLPVIYCRPSLKTILDVSLETKPHKSQEQVDLVKSNILKIVSGYDTIMTKIPHITFNRDKQTCAELIYALEKLM